MPAFYEAPNEPDFFATEQAIVAMRDVGTIALDCRVEELQAMLDYVEDESGKTLGAPLAKTSFVLMYGSRNPLENDRHYFESGIDLPLAPSSQFGVERPDYNVKHDLIDAGRHVFEVRPARWHGSVSPHIARMVLGPTPEDQSFAAGWSAWGRQFKDAFVLPDTKKNRIQEQVAQRFPGAVMLRRSTDYVPNQ